MPTADRHCSRDRHVMHSSVRNSTSKQSRRPSHDTSSCRLRRLSHSTFRRAGSPPRNHLQCALAHTRHRDHCHRRAGPRHWPRVCRRVRACGQTRRAAIHGPMATAPSSAARSDRRTDPIVRRRRAPGLSPAAGRAPRPCRREPGITSRSSRRRSSRESRFSTRRSRSAHVAMRALRTLVVHNTTHTVNPHSPQSYPPAIQRVARLCPRNERELPGCERVTRYVVTPSRQMEALRWQRESGRDRSPSAW